MTTLDDGVVRLREWTSDDGDWYAEVVTQDELIQRFTTEPPALTGDEVRAAITDLATRDDAVARWATAFNRTAPQ
jgi:hypothetical protein